MAVRETIMMGLARASFEFLDIALPSDAFPWQSIME